MRAHFGGYFFGQLATFVYLLQAMGQPGRFDNAEWPAFSVYNLVVANFWPLYWFAFFMDRARLNEAYWHVFDVARVRVESILTILDVFWA